MKKILLLFACIASMSTFSQVGIGTNTPNTNSILDLTATNKALLLPRVAGTASVPSPVNGMMVYDTSSNCVKGYEGGLWSGCLSTGGGSTPVAAVNCNTNAFEGGYANGVVLTAANKFSVTISNSSLDAAVCVAGSFYITDLVLSGVSGITVASVSPASISLSSGQSQLITYTLTGTPTSAATLTGTWAKGTLSCVKTVTVTSPILSSLSCGSPTNAGTLTEGVLAAGVTSTINYTGGDGSAYTGEAVNSTGVTGLTATLAAGNFAVGAGSVVYNITGTATISGTASFNISVGGYPCTLTRQVNSTVAIPASITLGTKRTYIIASVNDQDYLPYTAQTTAAVTTAQAADGTNESVALNIQGSITTAGITIKIPVTATGSSTLPPYSKTITIPASVTEDGISRDLTLSWLSQAYTAATKSITATLAAVGGDLLAKKLDLNAGIGNDALGVLMGTFTYPYDSNSSSTTYEVRIVPAIPDRKLALTDNAGNITHNMLYLPVVAEDGNIWLNNNLGAHYANISHPSFNLAQQATSNLDHLAFGSKFQWGRKPDGHELITYTSNLVGTTVYGLTGTIETEGTYEPSHALFIGPGNTWSAYNNSGLWLAEGENNPCPVGFRVPRESEFTALIAAASITNDVTAASSALKFTRTGRRLSANGAYDTGNADGMYWTATPISLPGMYLRSFYSAGTSNSGLQVANGATVRCIKD